MNESSRMVHVKEYEKFRKLAVELKPESILHTMQRAPLSIPRIALRLIFISKDKQYIFLDFPAGNNLRQTKIPIKFSKHGEAYIDDEDVVNSIREQLGRKDLEIHSMEVLGY